MLHSRLFVLSFIRHRSNIYSRLSSTHSHITETREERKKDTGDNAFSFAFLY
jgi:hypothetical protein